MKYLQWLKILILLIIRIIVFLFTHRLLLFLIALVIIVVAIYRTVNDNNPPDSLNPYISMEIPYYQEREPSIDDAPKVIQTFAPDLVYYYKVIRETGEAYILDDYWYYDNEEWEHGAISLPLNKNGFLRFRFYDR